ncbi:MAG: PVC-type heme-binding CxxCH protein, partial [Pirellulales bacterium]
MPEAFKATLFACDPLVEYPSAIALGPRPGSIFVAADYMTGLGTEIVRRDEIRLIEDTDGDGYADRATVYADGFNSIEGLTWHAGTVYAMHSPFLTALRDTDGDGRADERRDLLTGLGLPPEQNPVRLHCANGLVMGHDGWLYLALGDHGCDVQRPEGDRLVLEGGGILRCRPDGAGLHVFATGLRNIYDVALDDDLNVFVRDNENDGGDYKIRVCHSFFAADHGYPYLYYERPDEAMPPLADLGLGSSAGGLAYRERQFPAEYRGNLFFCEWGKAVVRYRPQRSLAGFAPLSEIEFAAGADNDPYGFKPTDLVVERDGSLIVADWADGQQPKRGRGRIYRITFPGGEAVPRIEDSHQLGLADWIDQLDSPGYHQRLLAQEAIEGRGAEGLAALRDALARGRLGVMARLHAVWILARPGGPAAIDELFELATADAEPRVQAQAVRALADLADPILVTGRLDPGPGDAGLAARLAAWSKGEDPRVLLEVVVAVGRLGWRDAPGWLRDTLANPDATLSHAAMQTLRRSGNWTAVLELVDLPDDQPLRAIALGAVAEQAVSEVAKGLVDRLREEPDAQRRRQYSDLLTRVYKRPAAWVYWGFRPPPRPPNTVQWEYTGIIEQALDGALADPEPAVRLAVLRRMQREKIPTRLATLGRWLAHEVDADSLAVILESLREHPAGETRALLEQAVRAGQKPVAGRLAALQMLAAGLDEATHGRLASLAASLDDGPVLAEALHHLARRPAVEASALLLAKSNSGEAIVRSAAVEAIAVRHVPEAAERVQDLLADQDAGVRRAAAAAAGQLGLRTAAEALLGLASDSDAAVRQASLSSLRLIGEPRGLNLAVSALEGAETQSAALAYIAELGGPRQAGAVVEVARRERSADVFEPVMRMLTKWREHPAADPVELDGFVAELHGLSGTLARWHTAGPLAPEAAARISERWTTTLPDSDSVPVALDGEALAWNTAVGTGTESRIRLAPPGVAAGSSGWVASSELDVAEETLVEFLAGSSGPLRIWLAGRLAYERTEARTFAPDSERFDAVFSPGRNRVLVHVAPGADVAEFHLRFRRKSSTAEHETFTRAALTRPGNADRGRGLFFDAKKTRCVQCHRLGEQGER